MTHCPKTISLTHRLVDRYMMLGLGCILVCLVLSLILAWRGEFTRYVSFSAAGPLLILLLGAIVLRRTVDLNARIEDQLRRIASVSSSAELALEPLRGTNPAVEGWNTILENISSHQTLMELESRLSQSLGDMNSRQLDQVLNSLPDGIALTDAEGQVVQANNAFVALFPTLEPDSIDGRPIRTVLSSLPSADSSVIDEQLGRKDRVIIFELQRGDAIEAGVLRISRHPVVNADATSVTHVWTARDITQQRLAEQMRNQFVFTATHELRTPLANIKAYAETLSMHDDIDVEQQKRFYNTLCSEATRLSRFVDELLNVSQMESGALSLSRHNTDVARLVEEVVAHVQPEIDRKKIQFEALLPPKLPELNVDKDKVSAALVNLLGNATKYTPEAGRVRFQVEADTRSVQFSIEDTGIGIAEDELSHVFDKFFRGDDDRVREVTGSGLGLAFTREVALLHGGDVTVHSELNQGSQFTMTLPA